MTQSFLQLCQGALEGIGGFDVPTTIFNNTDQTALTLKWAAVQTGRELARKDWQILLTPTTFSTSNGVSQYSKPSDLRRFANDTFYNVTQARQLSGPHSPQPWAVLVRGLSLSTVLYNFRVAADYIELTPTPTATETIGYDYYSRYYSKTSGGTAQEDWAADTDLARLPDDLFILGIRWRFLQRKELPFAQDQADYIDAVDSYSFDDTPKGMIDVSGIARGRPDNGIPDSNWG